MGGSAENILGVLVMQLEGFVSQNIESNRGIAFWRLGESMQRRLDEIVKGEANLHKLP